MSRHWQRPSLFAVLLLLAGIAIFLRLGFWQLDRGREKDLLLSAFRDAAQSPLVDFAGVRAAPPPDRYPHVRVNGHFDTQRAYLIDNQIRNGQAGVEVIGVFVLADDTPRLLVNRGWFPWSGDRGVLPSPPTARIGELELHGLYAPFPGGGLRLAGNGYAAQNAWPRLTLYIDHDEIALDLGQPLYERQLLLDAVASEPELVRDWTPTFMAPERHRAYAAQWFGFAIVALIIFIFRFYRKTENASS
jgi:surfeit locus 1 family protein